MKPMRKTLGFLSLIVCLALLAVVVPAQASDAPVTVPFSGEELASGKVLATVGIQAGGNQVTSVVLYDESWGFVAQAAANGDAYEYEKVTPGKYHLVAFNDVLETWASKEVEVQPGKMLQVALYPKKAVFPKAAETSVLAGVFQGGSAITLHTPGVCGGAWGDGRMLKIYPSYGQTIIYMQCGRVVGKVEGGGCSCGASGGWRYINDCQKSAPIYVTLPCPRSRH